MYNTDEKLNLIIKIRLHWANVKAASLRDWFSENLMFCSCRIAAMSKKFFSRLLLLSVNVPLVSYITQNVLFEETMNIFVFRLKFDVLEDFFFGQNETHGLSASMRASSPQWGWGETQGRCDGYGFGHVSGSRSTARLGSADQVRIWNLGLNRSRWVITLGLFTLMTKFVCDVIETSLWSDQKVKTQFDVTEPFQMAIQWVNRNIDVWMNKLTMKGRGS